MASGETDLRTLIASMEPALAAETYVFAALADRSRAAALPALMRFEEAEATTLIMTREAASAAGVAATFPCRKITLDVHSALEAVGFIARVATALAAEGMGVNPVAGFYHDHLFVPEDRADDAMAILRKLAADAA